MSEVEASVLYQVDWCRDFGDDWIKKGRVAETRFGAVQVVTCRG